MPHQYNLIDIKAIKSRLCNCQDAAAVNKLISFSREPRKFVKSTCSEESLNVSCFVADNCIYAFFFQTLQRSCTNNSIT